MICPLGLVWGVGGRRVNCKAVGTMSGPKSLRGGDRLGLGLRRFSWHCVCRARAEFLLRLYIYLSWFGGGRPKKATESGYRGPHPFQPHFRAAPPEELWATIIFGGVPQWISLEAQGVHESTSCWECSSGYTMGPGKDWVPHGMWVQIEPGLSDLRSITVKHNGVLRQMGSERHPSVEEE